MKKLLFVAFITLSTFGASDALEGECIALPASKKYISFDTSSNYPKRYQFTCDFECRSSYHTSKVTALHTVNVSSVAAEARDVVCYGVKVKRVSWGYDFDRVEKFFSYGAGLSEISSWARGEGISIDHQNSRYLMDRLLSDLKVVLPSYRMASNSGASGAKAFAEAVEIIEPLLRDLPTQTDELDRLVEQIPTADLTTHSGLSLVLRILSISAKWRM